MTSNNKKNRPADAQAKTTKSAVPSANTATTYSREEGVGANNREAQAVFDKTEEEEAAPAPPHPLDTAMDTFVAACAAYVDESGSNRSTVVGPYRLAFNGPQLISVTHV